jgi:hypothetical protein
MVMFFNIGCIHSDLVFFIKIMRANSRSNFTLLLDLLIKTNWTCQITTTDNGFQNSYGLKISKMYQILS